MLRIEPPTRTRHKPVVDSAGNRVGTVTKSRDDVHEVSVGADAPPGTLDALDWTGRDVACLPERLVADDADGADDVVRLVV